MHVHSIETLGEGICVNDLKSISDPTSSSDEVKEAKDQNCVPFNSMILRLNEVDIRFA